MTDFRSDTVTRPGRAMREAMLEAAVGDDVFGDDPSVNALQEEAAAMLGFDSALFAASGTQSNLIGIMSLCGRGDEVLVGQMAHTYRWEGGGMAVLGSIQPQPIENDVDGRLPLDRVRAAIKPDDPHFARTRLLALENTFNGRVLPPDYLEDAKQLAREAGLMLHLDGARLFNAAAALASLHASERCGQSSETGRVEGSSDAGKARAAAHHEHRESTGTMASARPACPEGGLTRDAVLSQARSICAGFTTVSICLSKGLGAPVGSLLLGSHQTISQARRIRKMLGGGLRQAGILAAAGRYALAHHLPRLDDDHQLASRLAEGLDQLSNTLPALIGRVQVEPARTNMVFVDIDPALAEPVAAHLQRHGLRFTSSRRANGWIRQRWVTHLDVGGDDVSRALAGWGAFSG